jgi:hypothetical protein
MNATTRQRGSRSNTLHSDSTIKALCDAGLYIVPIPPDDGKPSKAPKGKASIGWNQLRSISNPNGYSNNYKDFNECEGFNFGFYHGASNTIAFDIDNLELAHKLFEDTADIQLTDWLSDDSRFEIKSPKANRGKLIFKLPHSFNASVKQLKFEKEMIFELRCGNCQDVIYGQHPEGGNYQVIGNPESIPDTPPILLDMLLHWDDWKTVFESALGIDAEPPKYKPHKAQQGENIKGWRDPIAEFNQAHSVLDVLIRNSYKLAGKDRFIRPNSSSKAAGVVILNNCADGVQRAYSHGGDDLNDGFAHDAFDCMRLLEYGGKW